MLGHPYRPAPPAVPPCNHTARCCGNCHAAVGGCLQMIVTVSGVGYGSSISQPNGMPPLQWCEVHRKWEIEQTKE